MLEHASNGVILVMDLWMLSSSLKVERRKIQDGSGNGIQRQDMVHAGRFQEASNCDRRTKWHLDLWCGFVRNDFISPWE